MNNRRLAGQLQALADDTRLRILSLVADATLSATEINQALGMSQPRVAHHLKVLVDAGFLEARRDGRFVRYTLPADGFECRLASVVLETVRKPERTRVEPASSADYPTPARQPAAAAAPAGQTPTAPVPAEPPGGEDEEDDRRREMEDFLL